MISQKIITEFSIISDKFTAITLDMLFEKLNFWCTSAATEILQSNLMPDMLLNAICAMSLDEKEFLTLPVSRCLGSLIRMKQAFLVPI